MAFGEEFKAEREKRKLTQQEVADALGINRRMITRERHFLSAHQRLLQKNRGFEKMLNDLKAQAAYEADEMERLKAEGREKSATYRQFFGNRLFYKQLLNTYKKYGLMD